MTLKTEHRALFEYIHKRTPIKESDFSNYCDHFRIKTLKRNEFILRQGAHCDFLAFVNKGCLRLFQYNEEGKVLTRYFAFENKFGTSLSSFINQTVSDEYIQAIEPTELLMITRKDFYELVENVPEINVIYRDILEMAYTTTVKRIYNFQGVPALERLKWVMEYQPMILTRLPSKMVASFLGVTPYTLSRLKSEL